MSRSRARHLRPRDGSAWATALTLAYALCVRRRNLQETAVVTFTHGQPLRTHSHGARRNSRQPDTQNPDRTCQSPPWTGRAEPAAHSVICIHSRTEESAFSWAHVLHNVCSPPAGKRILPAYTHVSKKGFCFLKVANRPTNRQNFSFYSGSRTKIRPCRQAGFSIQATARHGTSGTDTHDLSCRRFLKTPTQAAPHQA